MDIARVKRALVTVFGGLALGLVATVGWAIADDTRPVGEPRVNDHWHAAIALYAGDQLLPPIAAASSEAGIHTHGDGIIHMHPHVEGVDASLAGFFAEMGGSLSEGTIRLPPLGDGGVVDVVLDRGVRPPVLRADSGIHPLSGAKEGASFGEATAICNGKAESEFETVGADYVPQDGDCMRIVLGP